MDDKWPKRLFGSRVDDADEEGRVSWPGSVRISLKQDCPPMTFEQIIGAGMV